MASLLPLPPRDPLTGGPLLVTRLENPETGMAIEGRFDLGWVGKLTREQLDFVGLLVQHRANVQRLASEVGISYNTARNRLDDIVRAMGAVPQDEPHDAAAPSPPAPPRVPASRENAPARDDSAALAILERLESGRITHVEAIELLRVRPS